MPRILVEEGRRSWIQGIGPAETRISVGRALSNKIILEDASSSREHCVIERKGDTLLLVDLGSRNGTRLNGKAVSGTCPLNEGDRIEIGQASITFVNEDDNRKPGPVTGYGAASAPLPSPGRGAADGLAPTSLLIEDPETGLASFAYLLYELRRRFPGGIEGSTLHEPPKLALVKLDIDSLGLLNDVFGFRAGDDVVRIVAQEVRAAVEESFGASGLVAREAGGKLGLLLPDADGERGLEIAERARGRLATRPFGGALRETSVTLSAGIAASPEDATSWRGLLRAAETALTLAKRLGRDRAVRLPPGERGAGAPERRATTSTVTATGILDSRSVRASTVDQASLAPLLASKVGQNALSLVAQVLATDLEHEGLLEFILSVVVDAMGAKRGVLVLRDGPGDLRVAAWVDREDKSATAPAEISQPLVKAVLETGRVVTGEDLTADGREAKRPAPTNLPANVLAAPICLGAGVIGVFYLDRRETPPFDAVSRELVKAFGQLVAGPIHRSAFHRRTANELERTRLALSRTTEAEGRLSARYSEIIGQSAVMKDLLRSLDRVAAMHVPVLVQGESGTGKELVARAVHVGSPRAQGPFVAENCAALPEQLLEAELFGHRKGAFTGADRDRIGLFEAASGGTLFLDEVGDMSERLQAKLLRVLQEGEVRPVGDERKRKVDVRVIAATNRDLHALMKAGQFREDLYYRLAVLRLDVPPLRKRPEDIPTLVEHLGRKAAAEQGGTLPRITKGALELLMAYDWPGNVRQLENEVRKFVALGADPVEPMHVSKELWGDRTPVGGTSVRSDATQQAASALLLAMEKGGAIQESIGEIEREVIRRVLESTNGNRSEVARRLGLSRPGLLKKMKRYGLE